jgi:hypothetical protein
MDDAWILHDQLNLVQSFRTYVPIAACDDGDAAYEKAGVGVYGVDGACVFLEHGAVEARAWRCSNQGERGYRRQGIAQ